MTDPTDIRTRLIAFVRDLLDPELAAQLTPETPLTDWGLLNSLGLARLIGFIRGQLGVAIPARELTGGNFRSIDDITRMVETYAVQQSA